MEEFEQKIKDIINDPNIMESQISAITEFISKCSLLQFENLKDLEYDLSENEIND